MIPPTFLLRVTNLTSGEVFTYDSPSSRHINLAARGLCLILFDRTPSSGSFNPANNGSESWTNARWKLETLCAPRVRDNSITSLTSFS